MKDEYTKEERKTEGQGGQEGSLKLQDDRILQPPCCGEDEDAGKEEMPCCSGRHKDRTPEQIRTLTNRLSRIEGQVRGIRKMVEDGAYCPDILTQSAAVSAAMNSFNRELLACHIRTCVVEDIKAGDDATIDELVKLLQKLMK